MSHGVQKISRGGQKISCDIVKKLVAALSKSFCCGRKISRGGQKCSRNDGKVSRAGQKTSRGMV